jgi:hypothetical protein
MRIVKRTALLALALLGVLVALDITTGAGHVQDVYHDVVSLLAEGE